MNDDELSGRLREAAEAHRPDRARMLARIERGMAGDRPAPRSVRPPRAVRPWLRVAGATAAVCGVLAAGAFAVTSAADDDRARGGQVASAPSATATAPHSPAAKAPGGLRPEDGPLWTGGVVDPHSNAYWAQSNVTLRTTEPLSALTVELRVAQTGGVNSTGSWRSLPEPDFTVSVDENGGFLVYRWTLRAGRTVPAGTHTFAGQYNHAEGDRDATDDSVTAHAVRASGGKAAVGDHFGRSR
ncbi:hypothetical protein ACIQZN_16045 [Streptomyces sp. NPDC097595]|uniref:hypothetical protein n=1 Tax=Streptomyces sp. NPDC097595 TaxID=3366090 RepID=UPI00380CB11E